MAWEMVNYACGHSEREQFYGPGKERERKLAWKERQDCPACYKIKLDAKHANDSLAASCDAAALGLPELQGSEKQIAWALTIRASKFDTLNNIKINADIRAKFAADRGIEDLDLRWAQFEAIVGQFKATYLAESSAKWWIDNRDEDLRQLCVNQIAAVGNTLFAPEIEERKANIAAVAAARIADREAEVAKTIAAKNAVDATSEATAAHFVPMSVKVDGNNFRIQGDDNHYALGYLECGATVVFEIDGMSINSVLPNAEALNLRCKNIIDKMRITA